METLSVVIPVYNSERTIGHLCQTLFDLYSERFRLDIILVNDGSTDSSDVICRSLFSSHPDRITYLKLARNFGEHNAVIAGLHQATGDYCVVMDDDFQNPPAELVKLVEEIRKGYDVVYASYASKRDSRFRNLGSRFHDRMANLMLRKPADLYLSSFKIMNRFLVREIVKYTGPDPYLDAIILRTTRNIGKVQLEHRPRTASDSGYTLKKLISLWGNMVISFSLVPIRIIGVGGLCVAGFGLGYGVYKALDPNGPPLGLTNYESLMSANLIFRGIVLVALSTVGEYVGRIYLLLNKDPQFVVRERLAANAAREEQVAYLPDYRGRDVQKDHSRTS